MMAAQSAQFRQIKPEYKMRKHCGGSSIQCFPSNSFPGVLWDVLTTLDLKASRWVNLFLS